MIFCYCIIQIHVIKELHGDKSKINACMMKENPGHWNWPSYLNTRREMESTLQKIESIFSTRLPDESFRGLINFLKATIPDTPIDEIERALVSEKMNRKLNCFVCMYTCHKNKVIDLFHRNIYTTMYQQQSVPQTRARH